MEEKNKLFLNPNEMAFRKIYKGLLESEKITTVFRPGKRLCEDFRGYCEEQKIVIKLIDKVGADWAMLPPEFVQRFSKEVTVKTIETKTLGEIGEADFAGASPDVRDKDSLLHHLGIIYNLSSDELTDNFVITRTTFAYDKK